MSTRWLSETIYVAPSVIDKVGIFTSTPLLAGDMVYRVKGRYVKGEFSETFAKMYPNWIGVSKEMWLDPEPKNPMIFMNHSCEPNAIVTEGLRVIALKPIMADEEILMDYSTTEIDPYWDMACTCNSPICRKTIRSFQFLPADMRRAYQPHMLSSLLVEMLISVT